MNIADKYRFYLTIPNQGEVQVFPVNNELSWKWKYDDKLRTWRYHLDTELCFKNNEHKTFNALWDIEKQCNVCFRIDLRVEKCCDDIWKDHWNGYLPLRKGKWNPETCTADITPRVVDVFSCLYDKWKDEYNLLEVIEDRIEVGNNDSEIVCTEEYFDKIDLFDLSQLQSRAESLYRNIYIHAFGFNNFNPTGSIGSVRLVRNGQKYDVYYEICQEVSQTQPQVLTGWVMEGAVWVRPANPSFGLNSGAQWYSLIDSITFPTNPPGINLEYINPVSYDIDNGLTLQSILEFFFGLCDLGVCSDFLFINGPGDSPTNIAYDCASIFLKNIAVFQASDIINNQSLDGVENANDQNATIFNKSISEFWCDFADRFNLQMWHDADNNCIRIEHISYRLDGRIFSMMEMRNGQICIKPKYEVCLKGLFKYEYESLNFPALETFRDKIDTPNVDFSNAYIKYPIECSDDDIDTNEKEVKQKCTITDLETFYNNPDYLDDLDILQSMFLVSLDANNEVISSIGAQSGDRKPNAPLSWANVIECWHLHNRPLPFGDMNGNDRAFLSTIPQKKQNGISIKMCCSTWEEFDPNMGIKTQFGIGYISDEIEYLEPYEILTFDLSHPCYN